MKTPEEIQKLLEKLDKAYKQLGDKKNPFANFDASNLKDAENTVNQLNDALEGVLTRIENTQSSFTDLSDTLKSVVKEINPKAVNATKDFTTGFKNIIREAKQLQYEEEGINLQNNLNSKLFKYIFKTNLCIDTDFELVRIFLTYDSTLSKSKYISKFFNSKEGK